jgi:small subunit ribosomal protein S4e
MITGGHNLGRVGTIQSRERHPGSFDIVHVKDANGHTFATRLETRHVRLELTSGLVFRLAYVFVIGRGLKPWVSLPSGKGLRLSVAEERDRRLTGKTH